MFHDPFNLPKPRPTVVSASPRRTSVHATVLDTGSCHSADLRLAEMGGEYFIEFLEKNTIRAGVSSSKKGRVVVKLLTTDSSDAQSIFDDLNRLPSGSTGPDPLFVAGRSSGGLSLNVESHMMRRILRDSHIHQLDNLELRNANLIGMDLKQARIRSCLFESTIMTATDCEGAIFKDTKILRCQMEGAKLQKAVFQGRCDLTGTNLQYAKLQGANLGNADLMEVNGFMADFRDVKYKPFTITDPATLRSTVLSKMRGFVYTQGMFIDTTVVPAATTLEGCSRALPYEEDLLYSRYLSRPEFASRLNKSFFHLHTPMDSSGNHKALTKDRIAIKDLSDRIQADAKGDNFFFANFGPTVGHTRIVCEKVDMHHAPGVYPWTSPQFVTSASRGELLRLHYMTEGNMPVADLQSRLARWYYYMRRMPTVGAYIQRPGIDDSTALLGMSTTESLIHIIHQLRARSLLH